MSPNSRLNLKISEKITLVGNLSTLLASGIPILEAVESLSEDTKGHQKQILDTLKQNLIEGKRVGDCLALFPACFDPVTVSLIRAAEEAGNLETALRDLQQHLQADSEFTDKIKFALIYPVFIMVIFVGMLTLILIFVIPKIAKVFTQLKVDLPLPTRILIFTSNLILQHTWWLVGSLVAMGIFIFYLIKYQGKWLKKILFGFPLVSQLIKQIDLTRLSRSLYLLLSSGLPITSALDLVKGVVFRPKMTEIIIHAREMIMAGQKLSDALKVDRKEVPSIVIKLVDAGEKSGTLDKSMQDISVFLDYQVSNTLKALTAILEPVMLLIVGVFVGGMVLAIIGPIYGLMSQIGSPAG